MEKQISLASRKIILYGTGKQIETTFDQLKKIKFTGDECADRMTIQKILDSHSNMAVVYYLGFKVYPAKNLLAELARMKKTNSIEKMSNAMYGFLSYFDDHHADKDALIRYYAGNYTYLVKGIHTNLRESIPNWYTDLIYIVQQHFGYYC